MVNTPMPEYAIVVYRNLHYNTMTDQKFITSVISDELPPNYGYIKQVYALTGSSNNITHEYTELNPADNFGFAVFVEADDALIQKIIYRLKEFPRNISSVYVYLLSPVTQYF